MLKVFTTFYGKKKLIDEHVAAKRTSAYALIVQENKILLIKNKSTGKWWFPGGMVDEAESLERAVVRETHEETGIDIRIIKQIAEVESYFYYDHADAAYHQFSFFYMAEPQNLNVTSAHNPDVTDEASDPTWVELSDLSEEEFQDYGWEVVQLIK